MAGTAGDSGAAASAHGRLIQRAAERQVSAVQSNRKVMRNEQAAQHGALQGDVFQVEPGALLAGPYPGHQDQDQAEAKLSALLDLGVDSFLDLTEEGEIGPTGDPLVSYGEMALQLARARAVAGIYLRMPIRDLDVPEIWHMEGMLSVIANRIADGGCVYVHCLGGVGRTGTVLGCRAIELGTPPTDVFALLSQLREGTTRADRPAPETPAQRAFVSEWVRRGDPPATRSGDRE